MACIFINSDMKSYLLITGANGFVGKNAVSYFLEKDYRIRALVRKNNNAFGRHPNLDVFQGDIKDYSSLLNATYGIDFVIHLAAAKSDESDSYEVNVLGTENLIKACRVNGVKCVVNISTISAKIKHKGLYAKTKDKAEQVVANGGVPFVTLRPSIIYGDTENGILGTLVRFSRLPLVPVIGSGEQVFAPIHVKDVVKAIEMAFSRLELWGTVYDVGGPDKITFNELINKIGTTINGKKRVRKIHIPVFVGYIVAKLLKVMLKKPPITVSNVLGSSQEADVQTKNFFRDFGFIPMGLNAGLNLVLRNCKAELPEKEARIMLGYICQNIGVNRYPTKYEKYYLKALSYYKMPTFEFGHPIFTHSWLLGPVDAVSRVFYKDSFIQRKLLIATALIECSTSSATALLSVRISPGNFTYRFLLYGAKGVLKFLFGLVVPSGLIKKYAGQ